MHSSKAISQRSHTQYTRTYSIAGPYMRTRMYSPTPTLMRIHSYARPIIPRDHNTYIHALIYTHIRIRTQTHSHTHSHSTSLVRASIGHCLPHRPHTYIHTHTNNVHTLATAAVLPSGAPVVGSVLANLQASRARLGRLGALGRSRAFVGTCTLGCVSKGIERVRE